MVAWTQMWSKSAGNPSCMSAAGGPTRARDEKNAEVGYDSVFSA